MAPDGRWRLPIHAFLVRTPDATVLVDSGAGSADTIAAEVFDVVRTLPGQLTAMGVELGSIDALCSPTCTRTTSGGPAIRSRSRRRFRVPGTSSAGLSGKLVVLVGDAFNHPQQVSEPAIPSLADGDRARANQTRRQIIERAAAGDWTLFGSAHLPGAWWSVDASDGRARWRSRVDDLAAGGEVSS